MRILRVRVGAFVSVAFTTDGQHLISSHDGGTLRLWDTRTGEPIHHLDTYQFQIRRLTMLGRDNRLCGVSAREGAIYFFRVDPTESGPKLKSGWLTPQTKQSLELLRFFFSYMAPCFSPDGSKLYLGANKNSVGIYDLNQQTVVLYPINTEPIGQYLTAIHISPDGNWLALGGPDGTVGVYSLETLEADTPCQPLVQLYHPAGVSHLVFAPDHKRLATIAGRTVRIWDWKSQHVLHPMKASSRSLNTMTFSPSGNILATAGNEKEIVFYEMETGTETCRYAFNIGKIQHLAFAPDGLTAVAGSCTRKIVMWDLDGY